MSELALPVPQLADGCIRLRAWTEADIVAMLAAFRDPWFQRFSDWAPGTTREAATYLREREAERRGGSALELAVADVASVDTVLGGVSLHALDAIARRASVGYWLAPHSSGHGVASRSVRLVASWAFTELRIARLKLTCGPDNVASQRVADRCGFRREGLLRSHVPFKGGRRDTVIFGLLPGQLS